MRYIRLPKQARRYFVEKAAEKKDNFEKTVFNQLDFKREILESDKRLFMLIAGVGAGKNYWVKTLTEKGHEDKGYSSKGYKVLLITSRAATVDAQIIKLDAEKRFDFCKLFETDDWWGDGPPEQKVVCCTNSYIEWYAKYLYDPNDPKTHVWNVFDFIILDEAHSMTSDATFSEAPFHVQSFLRYAHKHSEKCRIVLMSGTPEPIKWLWDGVANEKQVHKIDLYNKCCHIEPKRVYLLPSAGLVDLIANNLKKGRRIIYFATKTNNMRALIKKLNARGIPNNDIGISYSPNSKRNQKFPAELRDKMPRIKESLSKEEIIPPDIKILITTSKNKEGININDEDIKDMVVESHHRDEVRQMAGRVRHVLNNLVINKDALQHDSSGSSLLYSVDRKCLSDVNAVMANRWEQRKQKGLSIKRHEDIKEIESQFRYLRYDFFEDQFRVYKGRFCGDQLVSDSERKFQDNIERISKADYTGDYSGGMALQEWFPDAKIYTQDAEDLQVAVDELFEKENILGRVLLKSEYDELIAKVRELVKNCKQTNSKIEEDFKNFSSALKQLGYKSEYASGMRHGTGWIISNL